MSEILTDKRLAAADIANSPPPDADFECEPG
jgi:hypothetical protein